MSPATHNCLDAATPRKQVSNHALANLSDAGRRSLVLLPDSAWLVQLREGGDAAAVTIELSDGRVKGVIRLDVLQAQVLLWPLQGCGGNRYVVAERKLARVRIAA